MTPQEKEVREIVNALGNLSMAIGALDKIPTHLKKDAVNNVIPKAIKLLTFADSAQKERRVSKEEIGKVFDTFVEVGDNKMKMMYSKDMADKYTDLIHSLIYGKEK